LVSTLPSGCSRRCGSSCCAALSGSMTPNRPRCGRPRTDPRASTFRPGHSGMAGRRPAIPARLGSGSAARGIALPRSGAVARCGTVPRSAGGTRGVNGTCPGMVAVEVIGRRWSVAMVVRVHPIGVRGSPRLVGPAETGRATSKPPVAGEPCRRVPPGVTGPSRDDGMEMGSQKYEKLTSRKSCAVRCRVHVRSGRNVTVPHPRAGRPNRRAVSGAWMMGTDRAGPSRPSPGGHSRGDGAARVAQAVRLVTVAAPERPSLRQS
jgi:hypothetical protein